MAKVVIDTMDGMINDITMMAIIFYWRLNLITEISKESCLTKYKSNYVCGKYLVPLNKIIFSACRVSHYVGRDIRCSYICDLDLVAYSCLLGRYPVIWDPTESLRAEKSPISFNTTKPTTS